MAGQLPWTTGSRASPSTLLAVVLAVLTLLLAGAVLLGAPGQRTAPLHPPAQNIEELMQGYEARLLSICPSLMEFRSCRPKATNRSLWTDARATKACCLDLRPPGEWSFFRLQTFTRGGGLAREGGDSWEVQLAHNETGSRVAGRVFDEGNGTYTVAFVPLLPGAYSVTALLLYSRCLGYQDYPQQQGSTPTGEDWCYIGSTAALGAVVIGPQTTPLSAFASMARKGGGGRAAVVRAQEVVFANGRQTMLMPFVRPAQPPTPSRIVLLGDSTMHLAFANMAAADKGCRWLVPSTDGSGESAPCDTGPHGWENMRCACADPARPAPPGYVAYPLAPPFQSCNPDGARRVVVGTSNQELARLYRTVDDAASFGSGVLQVHYVFAYGCPSADAVREALERVVRENDTLIVNIGLHCVKYGTFAAWRDLVWRVAAQLAALPTKHVYWRLSSSLRPVKSFDGIHSIVYTEPRRSLFDLHAETVMRRQGIPVIDLFGLPVQYRDEMHFDVMGFDAHNRLLSSAVC